MYGNTWAWWYRIDNSTRTDRHGGYDLRVAVLISRSIEARLLSEPQERGADARDLFSPDFGICSPYMAIGSRNILLGIARVVKLADRNWWIMAPWKLRLAVWSIIITFSCLRMSFLLSGRVSGAPPRAPVGVSLVEVPKTFDPVAPFTVYLLLIIARLPFFTESMRDWREMRKVHGRAVFKVPQICSIWTVQLNCGSKDCLSKLKFAKNSTIM